MGAESLLCNEARRNLTDQQETAQWVGGIQVPKEILSALFSALLGIAIFFFQNRAFCYLDAFSLGGLKTSHGAVVVHPTAYDGCVELAAMQLGYTACGSSLVDSNYKCAREMVKSHLLQALHLHCFLFFVAFFGCNVFLFAVRRP